MSTVSFDTLTVEREARRHVITFTRSDQLNALDPPMLHEVVEAIRAADEAGVNVVVIRGEGRGFCAGVDLDTPYFMENIESDSVFEGMRLLEEQHAMIRAIHEAPFVTIASINGLAVGGGGFGMAMACDLRFAVEDARFWLVPGSLNVIQDFGLTWLLQRSVGMARTMELAFTGRRVDGATGQRWGFVNTAFADQASLDDHVEQVSAKISAMGPDSARMLKHVIRNGERSGLAEQLRLEAIANGLTFQSEEFARAKAEMLQRLGKKGT